MLHYEGAPQYIKVETIHVRKVFLWRARFGLKKLSVVFLLVYVCMAGCRKPCFM